MKNMLTLLKERQNRNHLLHRKSEVLFAFLFLMAMVIFGSFASPYFLTTRNLRNLLTLNIGMILLTFAQMYIILLGGVDLSVGSVVSMTSVICATMMVEGNIGNWLLVIILCLLASACQLAWSTGLLVTKGGLQPIIATLATQTVFAGVALVILPGPGGDIPSALTKFLTRGAGYAVPILFVLAFIVLAWIILNRTAFGRAIYAVGGNEQSAESAGIHVDSVKIKTFILAAVFAGVAGLYLSIYSTSGNPLLGEPYTQRTITAASGRRCPAHRRQGKRSGLRHRCTDSGYHHKPFESHEHQHLLSICAAGCAFDSDPLDQRIEKPEIRRVTHEKHIAFR